MKRRFFVVAGLALVTTVKAIAAKTKQSMGTETGPVELLGGSEIIYLKRGSVVKLPKDPKPVETIIHFSVTKYRFGKSPIILSNGHNVNGDSKEQIIVSKEVRLNKGADFHLQFTGQDVGWVILT